MAMQILLKQTKKQLGPETFLNNPMDVIQNLDLLPIYTFLILTFFLIINLLIW